MADTPNLPSYNDVQRLRLMEQVHLQFFDGWTMNVQIKDLLGWAIDRLHSIEDSLADAENPTWNTFLPDWFVWDGEPEDFLSHLAQSKIPGCFEFDTSSTIKLYVQELFGQDAYNYLNWCVTMSPQEWRRVKYYFEGIPFERFSAYLADCGSHTTNLKSFVLPQHFENLFLEAKKYLPPVQAESSPASEVSESVQAPTPHPEPAKFSDSSGQADLF